MSINTRTAWCCAALLLLVQAPAADALFEFSSADEMPPILRGASRSSVDSATVLAAVQRALLLEEQQPPHLLNGGASSASPFRAKRCASGPAAEPLRSAEFARRMDAVIRASQKCHNWTTLTIGVVSGSGSLEYMRGFGVKDIETGAPADKHTLLGIGSTTKAFTGLLLAVAAEERRLQLTDRVTERFGDTIGFKDPFVQERASYIDMMAHRTGLPRNDIIMMSNFTGTTQELTARIREMDHHLDFRVEFAYSNFVTTAAGWAVGEAYSSTFEHLVQTKVFDPLSMTNSYTSVDRAIGSGNYAFPVGADANGRAVPLPRDINKIVEPSCPAGCIISSPVDMGRYLRMLLRGGSPILKDVSTLYQPHTPLPVGGGQPGLPFSMFQAGYGLGWMNTVYRGRLMINHSGAVLGHYALVSMFPELDLGIFVASAGIDGSAVRSLLTFLAADLVSGDKPFVDERGVCEFPCNFTPDAPGCPGGPPLPSPAPVVPSDPPVPAANYAGVYQNAAWGTLKVTVVQGKLLASYNSMRTDLGFLRQVKVRADPAASADDDVAVNHVFALEMRPPFNLVFGHGWVADALVFRMDPVTSRPIALFGTGFEPTMPPRFVRVR